MKTFTAMLTPWLRSLSLGGSAYAVHIWRKAVGENSDSLIHSNV
jgi:hypothetical protein